MRFAALPSILRRLQKGMEHSQRPIQWLSKALAPNDKRQGIDAGHSPAFTAEVKDQ